jgi:hypothetical protein
MRKVLALGACLLAAGCGHGGGNRIERARLPGLVLQPRDLPAGLVRFDEGSLAIADAHPGPRANPARFGREGGWKARYRGRRLVVESRVDLFGSGEGAGRDLRAYREELETGVPGSGATLTMLEAPELGGGAVAARLVQGPAAIVTVAWREANATASVAAQGMNVSLGEVVELAGKQEARLEAAAKS